MSEEQKPPEPTEVSPTAILLKQQAGLEALTKQAQEARSQNVDATKAHHSLATDLFGCGYKDFRLPAGAIVDGVVYDQAYIKEMTGFEEDMLANVDMEIVERMENVTVACLTKLVSRKDPSKVITDPELIRELVAGTLPANRGYPLTSADRISLLLYIRRATVGDLYKYEAACPHRGCGHKNRNKALELDKLEITYNPHPERRRVKVKLPRSGVECKVRVLDGAGEKKAALFRPGTQDYGSMAIMVRLESIGGYQLSEMPPEQQLALVKAMPHVDRDFLRLVYQRLEGAVDTDVELTCQKCNREIVFPLDLGQVFSSTLNDKISDSDLEWL